VSCLSNLFIAGEFCSTVNSGPDTGTIFCECNSEGKEGDCCFLDEDCESNECIGEPILRTPGPDVPRGRCSSSCKADKEGQEGCVSSSSNDLNGCAQGSPGSDAYDTIQLGQRVCGSLSTFGSTDKDFDVFVIDVPDGDADVKVTFKSGLFYPVSIVITEAVDDDVCGSAGTAVVVDAFGMGLSLFGLAQAPVSTYELVVPALAAGTYRVILFFFDIDGLSGFPQEVCTSYELSLDVFDNNKTTGRPTRTPSNSNVEGILVPTRSLPEPTTSPWPTGVPSYSPTRDFICPDGPGDGSSEIGGFCCDDKDCGNGSKFYLSSSILLAKLLLYCFPLLLKGVMCFSILGIVLVKLKPTHWVFLKMSTVLHLMSVIKLMITPVLREKPVKGLHQINALSRPLPLIKLGYVSMKYPLPVQLVSQ